MIKKSNRLIPFVQYKLIAEALSEVLHCVPDDAGQRRLAYAVAGAYILHDVYSVPARPVIGSSYLRINRDANLTLAFAKMGVGHHLSSPTSGEFHCWIEVAGFAIDFMAPLFSEASVGLGIPIPSKMFQRPLSSMAACSATLDRNGSFFLCPDHLLGREMLANFLEKPENKELMADCLKAYKVAAQPVGPGVQPRKVRELQIDGEW